MGIHILGWSIFYFHTDIFDSCDVGYDGVLIATDVLKRYSCGCIILRVDFEC